LVNVEQTQDWDSRGHFFAAAAEAMRRIVVDKARRKASLKRGGDLNRIDILEIAQLSEDRQIDLIALDEALSRLEAQHPDNAEIVKLRFFAGLSLEDTAQAMGISRATAQRKWAFARAWLFGQVHGG
jgi:RNA polymerase sigma factor (TIGR02999 family)